MALDSSVHSQMERFIVYRVRNTVKNIIGMFLELEKVFRFIDGQPHYIDYEIHKLVMDEEGVIVSDKIIGYSPLYKFIKGSRDGNGGVEARGSRDGNGAVKATSVEARDSTNSDGADCVTLRIYSFN